MNKNSSKFWEKYSGEFFLLIVTILWGATFVIVKESLKDTSSMLFIALRFTIAGIIILPLFIKRFGDFKNQNLLPGILLGVLLFAGFATQTAGLRFTSATKSGFITGSSVVMIPFFQTILTQKFPSKGAIIGTVLVFFGILFLSSGGNSIFTFLNELGANFNFGDLLTLICAVFFAVYIVYLHKVSKNSNYFVLLILQLFVTGILGYLTAILFDVFHIETIRITFSRNLIFGLIYTSVFATLITTALQTKYQNLVTPTKAGIIFSFEPVFAAVIAFFAINEKISNFGLLGSVLIFVGLITAESFESIGEFYERRIKKS